MPRFVRCCCTLIAHAALYPLLLQAEAAKAREAIRVKLEEDKRERRRKLGLPEEPTEEELAKEAAKREEEAKKKEEAKRAFVSHVKPVTVSDCTRCTGFEGPPPLRTMHGWCGLYLGTAAGCALYKANE